jgi:RecB family exonuclease
MFEDCVLQYKLIYVDKIKRYIEGVEAFLGQRFHESMQWLYRERAFRIVPLKELLEFYEKVWAENWHGEVKINQKERTGDDYKKMGRRFIEDYYKRHYPFDEGRVLALERYIQFPLAEGSPYHCKGVIDRLMLASDGAFEIHDYKTSSGLPEQADLDRDRQLGLYQIGVQTLWPEAKEVRLVWHYVAFDIEMRSRRTPEALNALRKEIAGLIDKIEAEREFTPHESKLCDWCPHWDLCPAKKHLLKVDALPRNRWKDEPGVVIVDAYAELWRKKRGLEADVKVLEGEIDEIREAAIKFAEREDVQVIAGTDARLRVTGKERVVSPAKGSEEREALEQELRAAGVWDEVATLDSSALERAVAERRWAGDVLDRVKAYLGTEKRWTVTLKDDS